MSEAKLITTVESRARREVGAAPVGEANPMTMLQIAVQRGDDLQKLEKLMDLQQRWEEHAARKAYITAVAGFKAEPIRILKSKQVNIPGGAKFAHATLADVVDGAVPQLSHYGLSHRWETQQDGNSIAVTCILTHEQGHSERVTLSAPADDSGKKNTIQQIASTVTYLERYTFMAITGLAAKDMDDDARGAGPAKPAEPDGYDSWKADMLALTDEGLARLQDAWGKSNPEFRRYVVKYDETWWMETKAKAAKVPS